MVCWLRSPRCKILQRGDQLALEQLGAAAVVRHGGDGAHHRQLAHVAGAVVALQAPDRDDQLLRHAELLLDAAEHAGVALAAASRPRLMRDGADSGRDVFLEGLAEGAALAAVEGEHVRVDASAPAKAFCDHVRATRPAACASRAICGEEAVEVAAALGGVGGRNKKEREEEGRAKPHRHIEILCRPRKHSTTASCAEHGQSVTPAPGSRGRDRAWRDWRQAGGRRP